jgi:2-polyprenyl-6-methoxyphenol hydroxylase-like FAD-dependent oxidoreductase
MAGHDVDVVIAGGGPAGLTLAIELGRRGVACVLFDDKPGTTANPQAHATQARTMEHYRRLGFAHEVRALGLPSDYPTDMVCCTRFAGYELARFQRPSAKQAVGAARTSAGSWSTPELPHRCALMFVEPVLRRHAEKFPSVAVRFGWRVLRFREAADGVEVDAERVDGSERQTVRARYLTGCDGPRPTIRRQLGIAMQGESRFEREWMAGKMHAMYFRSSALYRVMNRPPAWMYFTINRDRRSVLVAVNGTDTFVVNAQLKSHEQDDDISNARALAMWAEALGGTCPIEVISQAVWHGGYMLVAERYAHGRVLMAGDAVHLFTPTAGLGYNTAVDDVCNLGWKLAAAVQGWGGAKLLASYEAERRPIGLRNTRIAKSLADSIGLHRATPALEEESAAGAAERNASGAYLLDHLQREFNIPGVTFGVRYDGSPIVVGDRTSPPPPDQANTYVPTACPGGRAPHWWLPDETSLFDRFGRDFTLLVTAAEASAADGFVAAAAARRIPLDVLHLPHRELRDLYEADLALIRPDQHVAWRGDARAADAAATLARATGH